MTTGRELARRPAGGMAGRGPAGGVATGDTTTHGAWIANITRVTEVLALIRRMQEQMLAGLTAANASETQIRDVRVFSDHVTTVMRQIQAWMTETDRRIRPLVNAVDRAGGYREVADPSYHADY